MCIFVLFVCVVQLFSFCVLSSCAFTSLHSHSFGVSSLFICLLLAGFYPLMSNVKAIKVGDSLVDRARCGCEADIILDCTCFYAEQGGQEGDHGIMLVEDDTKTVRPLQHALYSEFAHCALWTDHGA